MYSFAHKSNIRAGVLPPLTAILNTLSGSSFMISTKRSINAREVSIDEGKTDSNPVCYISYSKVRGHYSFGEGSHLLEQKGDQP